MHLWDAALCRLLYLHTDCSDQFLHNNFRFRGLCGRLRTTRANAFPTVALLLCGNVCEGVRSVDSCSLFARHLRVA